MREATHDFTPVTFVQDAEFVWARLAEGYTQEQTAEIMGWSRSQVAQYARLNDIDKQAWQVIVTTFDAQGNKPSEEEVTGDVTTVTSPFTENLLRDIVPLTAAQQRELVQAPTRSTHRPAIVPPEPIWRVITEVGRSSRTSFRVSRSSTNRASASIWLGETLYSSARRSFVSPENP